MAATTLQIRKCMKTASKCSLIASNLIRSGILMIYLRVATLEKGPWSSSQAWVLNNSITEAIAEMFIRRVFRIRPISLLTVKRRWGSRERIAMAGSSAEKSLKRQSKKIGFSRRIVGSGSRRGRATWVKYSPVVIINRSSAHREMRLSWTELSPTRFSRLKMSRTCWKKRRGPWHQYVAEVMYWMNRICLRRVYTSKIQLLPN